MSEEWRGGFLFVANHPAVDFVNTWMVEQGTPVDLLPDSAALVRWLQAAGLGPSLGPRAVSAPGTVDIAAFRRYREALRANLKRIEAGGDAARNFVSRTNYLLERYPAYRQLEAAPQGWGLARRFPRDNAAAAWAFLAESVASLLTETDRGRLRQCAGCVLHFLDTSKKGTRKWCSMRMCGNRAKVRAYTRRKKDS